MTHDITEKYCLSLPTTTPLCVWEDGLVSYINMSKLTGSEKTFSVKIMIPYDRNAMYWVPS
jgi:hypothetical protein